MKLRICIIAEAYPYEGEPRFPFVQQLAYSLSNIGVECNIIAPQSVTRNLVGRGKKKPYHIIDKNPEGKVINVYSPAIMTFSNTSSNVLCKISEMLFCSAVRRSRKDVGKCDAIYCYFWHVGLRTIKALPGTNSIFVQASECNISVPKHLRKIEYLDRVAGVVCASGKNRDESIAEGLTSLENTIVVVNGYRTDEFYKMDKAQAREKHGIPQDKFVVAFLGGFIKRKGLPQLCHVLDRFDDVYSIFIGKGEITPNCKNILFKGSLNHNEIVSYLNCADIFVLPTEAEGCCNAIIEALACGLPIISSNKPFNNEILDDDCSIRLDEHDEQQLFDAIKQIKDDENLRTQMSTRALQKAESLTIERRARAILEFLTTRIN